MHLFTYGTLCVAEIMEKVTGGVFEAEDAVLPGYQSFLIKGHSYPGMIRTGRSLAQGKVYYHLTAASMARIDAFEGEYYRRENVRPRLDNGAEIDAVAYVLVASMHYLLSDKPWSEEDFRRKHLHRYLRKRRS